MLTEAERAAINRVFTEIQRLNSAIAVLKEDGLLPVESIRFLCDYGIPLGATYDAWNKHRAIVLIALNTIEGNHE